MIELAGCVIFNEQGRLLLLHRNTEKRVQQEIPGGKVEAGENPKDSAIRELKEELDVDVNITKILGETDFVQDELTMHYYWFEAKVVKGKLHINEPQTFDTHQHFSLEDLRSMSTELSPNVRNLLRQLEMGNKLRGFR